MDGYVQHAYVGNKSIVDIDESKSTFSATNSKLTGKLEGTITKEYSGKTDRFSINLNSIPFYKDGFSPLAIFTTPSGDRPGQGDYICNKDYNYLKMFAYDPLETAEIEHPHMIVVDNELLTSWVEYDSRLDRITVTFERISARVSGSYSGNKLYVSITSLAVYPNGYISASTSRKSCDLTDI